MTPLAVIFSLPVRFYRIVFSPWVGHGCRYQPTCSVYALEALEKHGAIKGAWLAIRRIGRCHPWGASGYDPVPARVGDADHAETPTPARPPEATNAHPRQPSPTDKG